MTTTPPPRPSGAIAPAAAPRVMDAVARLIEGWNNAGNVTAFDGVGAILETLEQAFVDEVLWPMERRATEEPIPAPPVAPTPNDWLFPGQMDPQDALSKLSATLYDIALEQACSTFGWQGDVPGAYETARWNHRQEGIAKVRAAMALLEVKP